MSHWTADLQSRLEDLLITMLEGEPTLAQRRELNEVLHGHAEARELYIRTMALHAQLHESIAHQDAAEPPKPTARSQSDKGQSAPSRWQRLKYFAARPTPLSLAVAFVAIACMLGLMAVVAPPIYRAVRGGGDSGEASSRLVVARVVGTHDAKFASASIGRGSDLRIGEQIRLQRGLLELHYLTGERIVLEGPALFTPSAHPTRENCGLGQLDAGKLVAQVPAAAVGFSIETPSATIVDLGTQFGVSVSRSGTDVLVLQGQVLAHGTGKGGVRNSGTERGIAISAGQSYRFGSDEKAPSTITLAESTFKTALPDGDRQLDPYTAAVLADRPIGYWRLNERASSLAFNYAGRPHGMYHGGVELGADPRPGTAQRPEHRRSARFDGINDYVEMKYDERLNGEDFTIEVWVKLDRVPDNYGSVITSRDDAGRTGGYIIYISPQGTWELWSGDGSAWSKLLGPAADLEQWTHIAATFERTKTGEDGKLTGKACLYIDGEQVATTTEMDYLPVRENPRPLRIGSGTTEQAAARYYFPGQIADVAVYSRTLTAGNIESHFAGATATSPTNRDANSP